MRLSILAYKKGLPTPVFMFISYSQNLKCDLFTQTYSIPHAKSESHATPSRSIRNIWAFVAFSTMVSLSILNSMCHPLACQPPLYLCKIAALISKIVEKQGFSCLSIFGRRVRLGRTREAAEHATHLIQGNCLQRGLLWRRKNAFGSQYKLQSGWGLSGTSKLGIFPYLTCISIAVSLLGHYANSFKICS